MNRDEVLSVVRQFTGHENVIAVPRILIQLTGDPVMAMMLNQLLYWSTQKEWVYKSLEDWNEEIGCISRHRMEKFADLPYIETERRQAKGAPTTHYRINTDKFYEALMELINAKSDSENRRSIFRKPTIDLPKTDDRSSENRRSLTEITSETTNKDLPAAAVSETESNFAAAEVIKAYEQEIGMITGFVREEVLDAIERYPRDWIIEAIKEASKNNARKWSYVLAVLKSWQTNGYKTDVRSKRANNWRKPKAPDMGGYEVDHTSEIVINDNGEAFDGELQY